MRLLYSGLILSCFLSFSACSAQQEFAEVETLNEVQAVGSPFTRELADGYRAYANYEMEKMHDHPDGLHFARKGIAAARGENVVPEPVSDWNLLPSHIEELTTARGRLITALNFGAREIAPSTAAAAQVNYDCWIEQQEENWQANEILNCKSQFLSNIAELERMVTPPEPVDVPLPKAEPNILEPIGEEISQEMAPQHAMYLVFFDYDSAAVSDDGMGVLDAVEQELQTRSVERITITGHTDRAGPESYNDKLAVKRANAVRDMLAANGIDRSIIQTQGAGEKDLLVQTEDGIREPANRRVQITFH